MTEQPGRSSDPGSSDSLTEALRRAAPGGPASSAGADPGAALALAVHCIIIDAGLATAAENGVPPQHRYAPPPGWHGTYKDEWVFRYSAHGKANPFVLHCSLQRQSGRMFINMSETNNMANSQVLGLQLPNYVPDPSRMQSAHWTGVVVRQDALRSMVFEHLLRPLLEAAVDMPPSGDQDPLLQGGTGAREPSWLDKHLPSKRTVYTVILPSVTVAALAVAAAAVYVALQQQRRMAAQQLGPRQGRRH